MCLDPRILAPFISPGGQIKRAVPTRQRMVFSASRLGDDIMVWIFRFAAAALLLAVSGCGSKNETPIPPVPPDAKAGQITAEACTFTQLKHDYAARCGYLYVPEVRGKAGSRLIALPYTRVLSPSKTPGAPVFSLGGGPGQSNARPGFPVSWFIGKRDVVMLGFRGVDGTVKLDCPEINAQLQHGGTMLDEAGIAKLREGYRHCAKTLSKTADLAGYTILEVVDDIEDARKAFSYGKIDLAGISYGTRVALIYSWRYPDQTERSVLIDVNPPGRFWIGPERLDQQIRRYAALCAKDAYCSSRTKDLTADIRTALKNMPKRWLVFPIERDRVLFATFMGIYTTDAAASVFDMWIAAARGDYSGMALTTALFAHMLPELSFGDTFAKASSVDFDTGKECDGLEPGKTLIGSPLNVLACAGKGVWPVHSIPAEYREVQPSTVPTLLLGGSLDVATPYENARDELLPVMPNAQQVVIYEASHSGDLVLRQRAAAERLLASFFDTGRGDASLFSYHPVKFDPGWMQFGLIAKALVATAVLVAVLLSLLTWWIVRRLRRR